MRPGGTPPSGARAGGQRPQGPTQPDRPGVREQFGRVRSAGRGLIGAHVDLAKAEFEVIAGEIKIIAAIGAVMVGLALLLGMLLFVGSWLFVGEWLFGSMGWGLLHGTLLTGGLIVALAFILIGNSWRAPAVGFGLAALVAIVLSLLFASNILRAGAVALGDGAGRAIALSDGSLPTRLTIIVLAVVLGLLGLLAGLRAGSGPALAGLMAGLVGGAILGFVLGGETLAQAWPIVMAALIGLVLLAIAGAALGARSGGGGALQMSAAAGIAGVVLGAILGAVTFDTKGAVAIGITLGAVAWPVASFVMARREGISPMRRFGKLQPRETMAAVKETKAWLGQEWQRQRSKLSRG